MNMTARFIIAIMIILSVGTWVFFIAAVRLAAQYDRENEEWRKQNDQDDFMRPEGTE